jgi:hypothetical protein
MFLSNVFLENPIKDFPYLFNGKRGLLNTYRGSEKQIATNRADSGHVNLKFS